MSEEPKKRTSSVIIQRVCYLGFFIVSMVCFSIAIWKSDWYLGFEWAGQGVIIFITGITVTETIW